MSEPVWEYRRRREEELWGYGCSLCHHFLPRDGASYRREFKTNGSRLQKVVCKSCANAIARAVERGNDE